MVTAAAILHGDQERLRISQLGHVTENILHGGSPNVCSLANNDLAKLQDNLTGHESVSLLVELVLPSLQKVSLIIHFTYLGVRQSRVILLQNSFELLERVQLLSSSHMQSHHTCEKRSLLTSVQQ